MWLCERTIQGAYRNEELLVICVSATSGGASAAGMAEASSASIVARTQCSVPCDKLREGLM